MEDSILVSIKKLLGIEAEDTSFDTDLIFHINTIFIVLSQLGVVDSTDQPFSIVDQTKTWTSLNLPNKLLLIRTYMFMKVKLIFDPPSQSFVLEAYTRQVTEFENRIAYQIPLEEEVNA